jgi:hypothetical protein
MITISTVKTMEAYVLYGVEEAPASSGTSSYKLSACNNTVANAVAVEYWCNWFIIGELTD